jgi:large subunit ribosomal protein L17
MRHLKKTVKLGRRGAHRDAMLANQVCSLITGRRIKTTLAKAKATRTIAEKMVTLGKQGDLAARRKAVAVLKNPAAVKKLFEEIAPAFAERSGGYTRITKLGPRMSDASEIAILEWVESVEPAESAAKKK